MEIPARCPHCGKPFCWELSFRVDRELAWAAPHAPVFNFECVACRGRVQITFSWAMETGSHPRRLQLASGHSSSPPLPRILLVDSCPHGCGAKLGLQLDPDDPWAQDRIRPDDARVLGGYRCPRCDGEGLLRIQSVVNPASPVGSAGPAVKD